MVAVTLLFIVGTSVIFFVSAGTSQGRITPTPTPDHTQTATTPITTVTPTDQPSSPLLFFDEFLDNTKGWSTSDVPSYTRTINDGKLTLISTEHKPLIESVPVNTPFTDFSVTVSFTLNQGDKNDSVGLYLRGDSNLDHDYRVDIYGDSAYSISKESLTENNQPVNVMLIDHTKTPWLHTNGEQNTLTVMMKGSDLVLMLNGAIVKKITDTDYTQGQIALFVDNGNTSDEVWADISNITITTAPDQLP